MTVVARQLRKGGVSMKFLTLVLLSFLLASGAWGVHASRGQLKPQCVVGSQI